MRSSAKSWKESLAALGPKFVSLALPDAVTRSVLGGGGTFRVPESHWPSFSRSQQDRTDFDDEDEAERMEDPEDEPYETFPEWEASVDAAIRELGGSVFPKLNWSAPKDAVWMSTDGTLRCTNAAEVMLLLKSSDYAAADIEQARSLGVAPVLILKEWTQIAPSLEFRCFVVRRNLAAICQRNLSDFFPFLRDRGSQLRGIVSGFVCSSVLPAADELGNLVIDVFVGPDDSVQLLDIAELDEEFLVSNPSLVQWSEISAEPAPQASQQPCCLLRIVESSRGIQPSSRNLCGVPTELRDATAEDVSELLNSMEREKCKEKEREAK